MLQHLLPGFIMFGITVCFVTLMFIPPLRFPNNNKLINFYWTGIWVIMATIAAVAGAFNTLSLVGYDATMMANATFLAMTLCFMLFVAFAWARLSAAAIVAGAKRIYARFS